MIKLENYICETCGVQYRSTVSEPEQCTICNEERQYVNPNGQTWTTLEQMIRNGNFRNEIIADEKNLYSIRTKPAFGIGQTAYLVQNNGFNLLWDCISYIDQETVNTIKNLGGIDAIALSHSHYYSSQVEWAEVFGAKIYIHEDDRKWVMRQSPNIVFWQGDSLELHEGLVLHRLGGHFKGATVAEWQNPIIQKGFLLPGDIVRVMADRDWVSFMYSYPNFIPLPASTVQRMAATLNRLNFSVVYDAFHRVIKEEADVKVQKSAYRYIAALNGDLFDT